MSRESFLSRLLGDGGGDDDDDAVVRWCKGCRRWYCCWWDWWWDCTVPWRLLFIWLTAPDEPPLPALACIEWWWMWCPDEADPRGVRMEVVVELSPMPPEEDRLSSDPLRDSLSSSPSSSSWQESLVLFRGSQVILFSFLSLLLALANHVETLCCENETLWWWSDEESMKRGQEIVSNVIMLHKKGTVLVRGRNCPREFNTSLPDKSLIKRTSAEAKRSLSWVDSTSSS